jgi:hypothetical protein
VFKRDVAPLLLPVLGGGVLLPVEGGAKANILDSAAGIDYWHVSDVGVRGVASRIQRGDAWDTFTIRWQRCTGARTEFEKRIRSIDGADNGWVYPYITSHAYVGGGVRVGVAKTKPLYAAVRAEYAEDRIGWQPSSSMWFQRAASGGQTFLAVRWSWLAEHGVRVVIKEKKTNRDG